MINSLGVCSKYLIWSDDSWWSDPLIRPKEWSILIGQLQKEEPMKIIQVATILPNSWLQVVTSILSAILICIFLQSICIQVWVW